MRKISLILIVIVGISLILSGCGSDSAIPIVESRDISMVVTYEADSDVLAVIPDFSIPQGNSYPAKLHYDGEFTEGPIADYRDSVQHENVALLEVEWDTQTNPVGNCHYSFFYQRDYMIIAIDGPNGSRWCYDNIETINVIYTARLKFCKIYDDGSLNCQNDNISLKLHRGQFLIFTIVGEVTIENRNDIEDLLTYEGIDTSLLPKAIVANANYKIPLP